MGWNRRPLEGTKYEIWEHTLYPLPDEPEHLVKDPTTLDGVAYVRPLRTRDKIMICLAILLIPILWGAVKLILWFAA